MDPIEQYKNEVFSRFQSLPEEEKEIIKAIPDSPFAVPLGKLLGPEMGDLFSRVQTEESGEILREDIIEGQPQEEQPIRRAGLGSR